MHTAALASRMTASRIGRLRAERFRAHARGVTIVETLVALVVLSLGMLGIAGLFVVTLRSGTSAMQRTLAVGLASDIADRIRANRHAGSAYTAHTVETDNKCVGESSIICNPQEMAKNDLWQWRQEIARAFPGGNAVGVVEYSAGAASVAPSTYTIRIQWKGESPLNRGDPGEAEEYLLEVQVPAS